MSLTKNSNSFEEVNEVNNMADESYQFQEWQNLEEEAEKASFMRIFENTNTYPF
jgi:hypothetical protein